MSNRVDILFPSGRLVWTGGDDIYSPQTEDFDGNPLVYKSGDRKGQPRLQFAFGYAIAKTAASMAPALTLTPALAAAGHTVASLLGQGWTAQTLLQAGHATALPAWAGEPWGKQIYDVAAAAFRNGEILRPDFSWKIQDGDNAIPGKAYRGKPGRANKDKEGYPGHWVLTFSSDIPPKFCDAQGNPIASDDRRVKCGHYIQVYGNTTENTGASPGVYLNHNAVAYRAWGEEIFQGVDTRTVGFGKDALPPGASIVPQGNATIPAPAVLLPPPGTGGALPLAPGAVSAALTLPATPLGTAPSATTSPSSLPPPTVVTPHTAILTLPTPGAVAMPPPPAADPMLSPAAKTAGYTYANLKGAGWTDAQMRAAGHIL